MPRILAIILESAILVCALWVLSFLSVLLHEAGHALGCRIATGDGHWHIRVGWGKTLLNTRRLTVKLLPFDGYFSPPEPDRIDTAAKWIGILAGGPAVSLLAVIGLSILKFGGISFQSEVLAPGAIEFLMNSALSIHLFLLILSVIPAHYFWGETKGVPTDGMQIIRVIRSHRRKP